MTQYRLSEVRQVCEVIYGQKIVDRTWRRWKASLGFDKYVKEISELKMQQLIILANLKRSKPYDKVTLTQVIDSKQKTLEDFKNTRNSYMLHLTPDECKGSKIPEVIQMVTGQSVSIKTLYRWGEKVNCRFSATNNYSKNELLKYISQAFIKPNEEKADRVSGSAETA